MKAHRHRFTARPIRNGYMLLDRRWDVKGKAFKRSSFLRRLERWATPGERYRVFEHCGNRLVSKKEFVK